MTKEFAAKEYLEIGLSGLVQGERSALQQTTAWELSKDS